MSGRQITFLQAVAEAMYQAMEADERVIALGEDITGGAGMGAPYEGSMGGTFGATKSLFPAFGNERVRDTPISEAAFSGVAIGAAAAGLRPVVDMMWSSFTALAFDQIFNQAAKMRYMFGGQASVPVVFRMAMGAGLGAAGQHSDTLHSIFTHIPGLKVVLPSNPFAAKGLLTAAIEDDNPVIFMEHMKLYGRKGDVPEGGYRVPLGIAEVVKDGTDVTIVATAYMVHQSIEAADRLAAKGVSAEVVDPQSLSPLDHETICTSVAKTGRLVIVDESPPRCSIATDIAAMVGEELFGKLRAPIRRVTAPHSPVPLSPPLENAYIPSVDRIVAAVKSLS
ncbi:MAG TPA: alpha-ketoacid dehydrogenase subunit beta [Acidimicrobiia bacterium]|nr:alpha-ketoacid dehydrogenase subunit beta [Acidimicrobiia bacterium]